MKRYKYCWLAIVVVGLHFSNSCSKDEPAQLYGVPPQPQKAVYYLTANNWVYSNSMGFYSNLFDQFLENKNIGGEGIKVYAAIPDPGQGVVKNEIISGGILKVYGGDLWSEIKFPDLLVHFRPGTGNSIPPADLKIQVVIE